MSLAGRISTSTPIQAVRNQVAAWHREGSSPKPGASCSSDRPARRQDPPGDRPRHPSRAAMGTESCLPPQPTGSPGSPKHTGPAGWLPTGRRSGHRGRPVDPRTSSDARNQVQPVGQFGIRDPLDQEAARLRARPGSCRCPPTSARGAGCGTGRCCRNQPATCPAAPKGRGRRRRKGCRSRTCRCRRRSRWGGRGDPGAVRAARSRCPRRGRRSRGNARRRVPRRPGSPGSRRGATGRSRPDHAGARSGYGRVRSGAGRPWPTPPGRR